MSAQDLRSGEFVLVAGDATEQRAQLPVWSDSELISDGRIVRIFHDGQEHVRIERHGLPSRLTSLWDATELARDLPNPPVLLDISGLFHHVWAPILRSLLLKGGSVRVLYCEPSTYRRHSSPASATTFDLSDSFDNVGPLPGFAKLTGPPDESRCVLVAALGFEGNRPENLLTQLSPPPKTVPLIGVPGFQIEYPTYTVDCNRDFLARSQSHAEIRLARASCPFEAYNAVRQVARDNPGHYLYLAPVGTKPHALGLVLYAIKFPDGAEIVYDHPTKKPGRTSGIRLIHLYDLSDFHAW